MKKITKKKEKSMARTAKKKSLSEWSKSVRERDGFKCAFCECCNYLNAHHILPKENYKNFMFEVINGITLCPSHHKFGKFSAHRNPVWFIDFLKEFRPEQYKWAKDNLNL